MASDTIEDEDDPETEISPGSPQSLKVNHHGGPTNKMEAMAMDRDGDHLMRTSTWTT